MPEKTQIGTLLSVQIGIPKTYGSADATDASDRVFTTSFVRVPVAGPRWLYRTHLDGNAQADTQAHGSPNHAVLLYASTHYPRWQTELKRSDISFGGFAENFTVGVLDEHSAYLGDTYQIGQAEIAVTDPRFPCSKIERCWQIPGLTARVRDSGRTGWMCGVIHEGIVEAGMAILLRDRPFPDWSIARVNDVIHGRVHDRTTIEALMACPGLNPWWLPSLSRQLAADKAERK